MGKGNGAEPDRDTSAGITAIFGGTLLVVGPFLPWMTLGPLSHSGMDKSGGATLPLIFIGVVAIVLGANALMGKALPLLLTASGVIAGAFAFFFGAQIYRAIASAPDGFGPSMSFGIYVTALGALMTSIAPLLAHKASKIERLMQRRSRAWPMQMQGRRR